MANYIQEYYDKIQNGEIIVGKWILKVYEYLIHGLEEKRFFFNERKADLCITFIENFVHHHEGALAPSLFKLELWQKALLSAIFGIVNEEGKRVHKEIVIEIGRKNGKTLLASAIAQYVAYCEPDFGKRIYFAAPKLKQANLCFDAFYQSILKEPSLSEITKKRRTDIYIAESNTSCEPLAFSSGKSDGLNISLGICDEISSWSGDSGLKYYEVLKSSQGAREEPLLVSISTSGFVNESIFDELERRCTRFLLASEDETRETTLLPFLYKIDDIKKWNEPSELAKANPNLGVSVPLEYLQNEAVIASMSLSKKSEFITNIAILSKTLARLGLMLKMCKEHVESLFNLKTTKATTVQLESTCQGQATLQVFAQSSKNKASYMSFQSSSCHLTRYKRRVQEMDSLMTSTFKEDCSSQVART